MRLKTLQRLLCRYTLRVRARAPLSHLVPTRKDVQDVRDDEPREEHVPAVHHHEVERVEARDLELEERDHDERRKQTVEVTRRERERRRYEVSDHTRDFKMEAAAVSTTHEIPRKMNETIISSLSSALTRCPGLPMVAMTEASPRPRHAVRRGEPKTLATPIFGRPARATEVSATKSPIELAHARSVMPRIAEPPGVEVMPVMTPRTWGGGGETAREMSCLCVCVVQCALSPLPSLHTHLKDRDTLVPNHVKPRNCRDKTDENKDHVPARRRSVIRQEEDHKRGDNREGEWDDEDRGVARRRGDRLHQRGERKKEVLREHETSAARRRKEEEEKRRLFVRTCAKPFHGVA